MNGILNILKPTWITSSGVVSKVRRILNTKEVGHMGTLDPMGAGVLIVGVGKSNRLFNYFNNKDKEYRTIFKFGIETDTLDSQGKILSTTNVHITKQDVEDAIKNMVGESLQLPPIYSALKINGRKSYELARHGQDVELKPRKITIYDFKLIRELDENEFEFDIVCSSGTYIRSICRDLAKNLNTIGYMESIIRTRSGKFSINDSVSLNELNLDNLNNYLVKPENVFDFDKVFFDGEEGRKILNGIRIPFDKRGEFYVFIDDHLYGIGECMEGFLKVKTVLR